MSRDETIHRYAIERPAFLAPNLAQAVALLNAAGFCVVQKNRMAEVSVHAGVESPPEGTPKDQADAHWNAIWTRLGSNLLVEIAKRQLYVTGATPMADKPRFMDCKVATIVVTPPGATSAVPF